MDARVSGGVSTFRSITHHRLLAGVSCAALALSLSLPAAAQNWTGATSTDWTDGANWDSGVVPTDLTLVNIDTTSPNPAVLGVNGAATGFTDGLAIGRATAGQLTVQSGSVLTSDGNVVIGVLSGNGTLTVTGGGSRFNATAGTFLLVANGGTGTLNIENGGAVTAQGGITVATAASDSGTLNINSGGTLETTALRIGFSGSRQVNFDNGTLRALGNSSTWVSGFTGTEINIAAGGLTLDSNGFAVGVQSPFSGVGSLTKTGAGMLTLTGANTYTAGTEINAGTLALGAGGRLPPGSILSLNAPGVAFDISASGANQTIGALTGSISSTIELGANALTFGDATTRVFAGSIVGTGGIVKQGAGTQTLTGYNVYTGGTTVMAGTLALSGIGRSPQAAA